MPCSFHNAVDGLGIPAQRAHIPTGRCRPLGGIGGRSTRRGWFAAAHLGLVCVMGTTAGAQPLPPYRSLGPVEARSSIKLASVSLVRPLPNGNLLVHDLRGRRVVLLDSALDSLALVADATDATDMAYTSQIGGLIAWHADSTLFVDPESLSMLMIDGGGHVTRIMALPSSVGPRCFIGGPSGTPSLDARGRIVCRMPPRVRQVVPQGSFPISAPEVADSAALVRYDPLNRRVDTAAFLRVVKTPMTLMQDEDCAWVIAPMINPLPTVDDWAVMADGSIAIVRGGDYHIEWIHADGSRSASARLPLAPTRLTDDEKAAYLDSSRAALEKLRTGSAARAPIAPSKPPERAACDPSRVTSVRLYPPTAAHDPASMAAFGGRSPPPLLFVSPSELPDYVPPFGPGNVRADLDGNLWIRTLEGVNGGAIHHVVNRGGRLIARILVPPGRVIAGFGTGGAVFMGVVEKDGVRLERARFK